MTVSIAKMTHTDNPILGKYLGQPAVREHVAAQEEIKAAYQRIKMLEADLEECREFIEVYVDVNDGEDGQPTPNKAMRLVSMIDESLHGPGNF